MPRYTAPTTRQAPGSIASTLVLACMLVFCPDASLAEPARGNELTPDGLGARTADELGLSALFPARRRSPSGLLYPYPAKPSALREIAEGWFARGSLEFGVYFDGGDERETRFEQYTERDDEAFLNGFELELINPDTGTFFEFASGGIGRDDQFYRFEAGRHGWLLIEGGFDRVPHRFASDARVLLQGTGSDSQTLPPGFAAPGTGTPAQVQDALAAVDESTLELRRDRSALRADLRLSPEVSLFVDYKFEDRRGARPFGVSFGFPGNGTVIELAEPLDDRTHRISTGLAFSRSHLHANLEYRGSFFRNHREALTIENPLEIKLGAPTIERARFALPPDNTWHNLRGDFALGLPLESRLTATVSVSRMEQDEDLLPPTVNDVAIGAGGSVDLSLWNTTGSLSRLEADAQIDTLLLDFTFDTRPLPNLALKARYRYFDQDNDTDYSSFNPLTPTDERGYIIQDGGLSALSPARTGVEGAFSTRFRSIPFGYDRTRYQLAASYRLPARTRLALDYERDEYDRDFRERRETREDRVRASITTRKFSWMTLRTSVEVASRNGGSTNPNIYDEFFTAPGPGSRQPPGLADQERPDVANRDQWIWSFRLNVLLGERSDLILTSRLQTNDYRVDLGLKRERYVSLNAEWSFQASPTTDVYLYGGFERVNRGHAQSTNPEASLDIATVSSVVSVDDDARTLSLGGGLRMALAWGAQLQLDYRFQVTREEIDYDLGSAARLVGTADPGSSYPKLRLRDHVLETSIVWPLREALSLRLYQRYARSSIDDYPRTDLFTSQGQRVFFGHEDEDYEASVYGIALRWSF